MQKPVTGQKLHKKGEVEAKNGHLNINYDTGAIRYEYPRNIPLVFHGVLKGEQIEKWVEEKRERVEYVGMVGEKMEFLFSNLEQAKEAIKRLGEIVDDLNNLLLNTEEWPK